MPGVDLSPDHPLGVLHRNFPLGLRDRDDTGHHRQQQENQRHSVEQIKLAFGAAVRSKHDVSRLNGAWQVRHNSDGNDQRNAIADAAFRDLFPQPHQQQCAGRQNQHSLNPIPPEVLFQHQRAGELRELLRMFPGQSHERPVPKTQYDCQATAILDKFGAPAFFPRQFAQLGNHCRHQLDNDGRGDVGHDSQGANGAMLKRAACKEAVHA